MSDLKNYISNRKEKDDEFEKDYDKDYLRLNRNINMIEKEWEKEPDELSFLDAETGYECLILRNNGHLCGYVRIPAYHPLFNIDYRSDMPFQFSDMHEKVLNSPLGKRSVMQLLSNDEIGILFDVHGGITFSGELKGEGFWYGFDCSHCGDFNPILYDIEDMNKYGWKYRNIDYVKSECASLAKQIKSLVSQETKC